MLPLGGMQNRPRYSFRAMLSFIGRPLNGCSAAWILTQFLHHMCQVELQRQPLPPCGTRCLGAGRGHISRCGRPWCLNLRRIFRRRIVCRGPQRVRNFGDGQRRSTHEWVSILGYSGTPAMAEPQGGRIWEVSASSKAPRYTYDMFWVPYCVFRLNL